MTARVLTIFFAAILCGLAVRGNARFRGERRLPMQWWLNGDVTWWAPRPLALALVPALGIGMLLFHVVAASTIGARPGQEHLVLPVLVGLGATAVAIQILHHRLIAWTLRRRDG